MSLIYQIFIQLKKKAQKDVYQEQMQHAVNQTTRELQKFFDLLQLRPTAQGNFGENIVQLILGNLPNGCVKSQYQPADISGRIDFTVQLPNTNLLIPIDSKFILPQDFQKNNNLNVDKYAISHLNKKTIHRAKEITKYSKSAETTDFVLMFIPDFVYGVLEGDTMQKLASLNVVPTNTSGLLSTIFMINMQYRFTSLNQSAKRFGDIQIQVCQGLRDVIETMQKGSTQLQYCMNNFTDAQNTLSNLKVKLENLDVDQIR
jgi:DNA anti-recombination protein RmuC